MRSSESMIAEAITGQSSDDSETSPPARPHQFRRPYPTIADIMPQQTQGVLRVPLGPAFQAPDLAAVTVDDQTGWQAPQLQRRHGRALRIEIYPEMPCAEFRQERFDHRPPTAIERQRHDLEL